MRVRLGWLQGSVSAVAEGPNREAFLNRCAALGADLWTMEQMKEGGLMVTAAGRKLPLLGQAAAESGCTLSNIRKLGLPFFLFGLRTRYALLAGLLLCLGILSVGSKVVLDIEVIGNETLSDREILCQLRLCGLAIGAYGPSVPIREVENRMLQTMDRLDFCALTFHGTRAALSVREAEEKPKIEDGTRPADVIAIADGVITHMEPWAGDAQYREGDAVLKGEVLISGTMTMDPPAYTEQDLGTMTVRASGRVLARTWRTLEAKAGLTAPGKVYTGRETRRYSLNFMGRRVNFYQNSGISYGKYDRMTQTKTWAPLGDRGLPVLWQRETIREYETAPLSLDPEQTGMMLKKRLTETLAAQLDEGKILRQDYLTRLEEDTLAVTLLAQCSEQIGRTREWGEPGDAVGPILPDTEEPLEGTNANDRTDREH